MLTPFIHTNPQCYIQEINSLVGSNTRLQSKDCVDLKTNLSNNKIKNHYADNCAMSSNEELCIS
jgi:hypothetical protein